MIEGGGFFSNWGSVFSMLGFVFNCIGIILLLLLLFGVSLFEGAEKGKAALIGSILASCFMAYMNFRFYQFFHLKDTNWAFSHSDPGSLFCRKNPTAESCATLYA